MAVNPRHTPCRHRPEWWPGMLRNWWPAWTGIRTQAVSRDADDDHVLACAIAAQADLIVSGDEHLLSLKIHQNIPILTPAEALRRIEAQP